MTGYHNITDEDTVDDLRSEEMTGDDNEDDGDEEKKTFVHTTMLFKPWT
jgi:hypothetical protein